MAFEFIPEFRRIGNLLIYFKDKRTILVSEEKQTIMFHRWHERSRGFYKNNWRPFLHCLKRRNNLSLIDISRIALRYEIDSHAVTRSIVALPPRGIKELPSVYIPKARRNV